MAHTYEVVVGDRGRLVLPSPVRSELGLEPGTRMTLTMDDDGTLTLRSFRAVAEQARGLWADLVPPGVSLSDELIAERRAEARREDTE